MTDHSRRRFLRNASIGAAAVGATAVIPAMAPADAAAPQSGSTQIGPAHDGPFTVWVKDARSGEIAVLVGEKEIVHQDKALAATLARIAARG